uniref:Ribosomal protein L6 n=1 Tax=Spumella sp. NIES-1846 TaxID=2490549 RepID=A0A455RGI5_9STRA|nr:ribosomal protein L6 [Spumella sp. NIES-1846]
MTLITKLSIPQNINLQHFKNIIYFKGPYGLKKLIYLNYVLIFIKLNTLIIQLKPIKKITKKAKAYYGMLSKIIQNIFYGLLYTYTQTLFLKGIGYKFIKEDKKLFIKLGYSHLLSLKIPKAITINIETQTKLIGLCIDKNVLSLFINRIRQFKLPNKYTGQGVLYPNEIIKLKNGKAHKTKKK